jgi:hypothetical protein
VPRARWALDGTILTVRSQTRDGEFRRTDDRGHMVVTCANPQCSRSLEHRYEGRVFRLRLWPGRSYGVPDYLIRYFRLCASCSSAFTLVFDQRRGVSLAPLHDADASERKSSLIFDIAVARFPKRDTGWIGNEHEPSLGTALSAAQEEMHHGRKRITRRKTRSRR